MNEDINILEKNIEYFLNIKNSNIKNSKFKAYIYQGDENTKNINVIYDNQNYIHFLLNIPEDKEYIIKEKNEYEITITDSSYDLFFYKSSPFQNTINCILILIINDIDVEYLNENYLEFKEENLININQQDKIINQIKEKIKDFIKKEKEKSNNNANFENITIGENDNNFLFNKNIIEDKSGKIKIQIEKLSKLVSKVEIRKQNNNYDIDNLFMNVFEVLSPLYKSMLSQKYMEEMPINLYNLMEKYQDAQITKDSFEQYKKNKLLSNNTNNNTKIYFNNIKEDNNIINKIHDNKNIFNLKKYKNKRKRRQFKVIKKNKNKTSFKVKKDKKNYFKIFKKKHEIKKEFQKNDDNNKMIIEEEGHIKDKNKNIFKCVTIPKKKEMMFVIKKKK